MPGSGFRRLPGGDFWWVPRRVEVVRRFEAHNSDPVVDQLNYRWGNPGTESGHTFSAALNTAETLTGGAGDVLRFLRVELEQSLTNADQNLTQAYQLQTRIDTGSGFGSWFNVDNASADWVDVVADANLTDGADTTNRITGSTETFVTNNNGVCDVDDTATAFTWNPGANNAEHAELLFSLRFNDVVLGDGDIVEFRIVESGGTLIDTYTQTPTINWSETAAGPTSAFGFLPIAAG